MALFRYISMTFWTDPKIADNFTPEDKYFYLYLLTNTHTNLCGCYEISVRQMAIETGYSKETIEKLLDRFRNIHRVIDYSEETKEILLTKWQKNNWTNSEKYIKGIRRELKDVKNEYFKEFLNNLLECADTVSIGYQYPMHTSIYTNTNTNTNTYIKKENDPKPKKRTKKADDKKIFGEFKNVLLTDEEFEKLQDLFPKHYQKYINNLSTYIESKGAKYKSHYATLRQWLNRDGVVPIKETDQDGQRFENGFLLFNIDEGEQTPPFFGFPPEWFDEAKNLIPEKVVPIKQRAIPERGRYEEVIYSKIELLEKYKLRGEYFENNSERHQFGA